MPIRIYKQTEEHRRKISLANKGHNPHPMTNEIKQKISKTLKDKKREYSEETRKKLSLAFKGKHHTEEAKRKIGLANSMSLKGNHHSDETKKKISLSHRGSKSYNWKGGVTSITNKIRNSIKYVQWRQQIFIKDNFTCQKCGDNTGGNLNAHHKNKSFSKLLQEVKEYLPLMDLYDGAMIYTPLWDINNGITLCKRCHIKLHYGGVECH